MFNRYAGPAYSLSFEFADWLDDMCGVNDNDMVRFLIGLGQ